jgi:hypothetical protein
MGLGLGFRGCCRAVAWMARRFMGFEALFSERKERSGFRKWILSRFIRSSNWRGQWKSRGRLGPAAQGSGGDFAAGLALHLDAQEAEFEAFQFGDLTIDGGQLLGDGFLQVAFPVGGCGEGGEEVGDFVEGKTQPGHGANELEILDVAGWILFVIVGAATRFGQAQEALLFVIADGVPTAVAEFGQFSYEHLHPLTMEYSPRFIL